jgi:hypothetical protein
LIIEQEVIVPAGEYPARVAAVEEYIVRGRLAEWREMYLRWAFRIEGGPTLAGWTRRRFARGSRLYTWVQAALGHEIAPDYALNTAALTGRPVRVKVLVAQDAETGELSNRIAAVLPWPAGEGSG